MWGGGGAQHSHLRYSFPTSEGAAAFPQPAPHAQVPHGKPHRQSLGSGSYGLDRSHMTNPTDSPWAGAPLGLDKPHTTNPTDIHLAGARFRLC